MDEILNIYKHYDKKKIKGYVKQRAKRGFCEADCYEINNWFLVIMPKMLENLLKHNKGIPTSLMEEFYEINKKQMNEDAKDCIILNKIKHNDPIKFIYIYVSCKGDKKIENWKNKMHNYAKEKWNKILNKMIFLFKECDETKCSFKNKYEKDYNDIGRNLDIKQNLILENNSLKLYLFPLYKF